MDRTQLCGSCNVSSILTESTKENSLYKKRPACAGLFLYTTSLYFSSFRAIAAASRDFFRAALFFLIIPRFAALSIAL